MTHETVDRWTDAIGHAGLLLTLAVLMLAASLGCGPIGPCA